jgi:autotransporter-associated beta strand protein
MGDRARLRGMGNRVRPILDQLDTRDVPATWDGGGGADTNWTTGANWEGDVAPIPGEPLIFPANVASQTANNDFPAGTAFASITIQASGYNLTGNPVALTGGIAANYVSATAAAGSTIGLSKITFTGPQTISTTQTGTQLTFATGTVFDISGGGIALNSSSTGTNSITVGASIQGAGNVSLGGAGQVLFNPTAPNTYTGSTSVGAGTLQLQGTGVVTIPAELFVGDGVSTPAVVQLLGPNQVADTTTVSVASDGTFDVGANPDTIANLALGSANGGGTVAGSGIITLTGGVFTFATSTPSTIAPTLQLTDGVHQFNISRGTSLTSPDLVINGSLDGTPAAALQFVGAGFTTLQAAAAPGAAGAQRPTELELDPVRRHHHGDAARGCDDRRGRELCHSRRIPVRPDFGHCPRHHPGERDAEPKRPRHDRVGHDPCPGRYRRLRDRAVRQGRRIPDRRPEHRGHLRRSTPGER